jgi:archaellum component FlaF (FlaF/FlaG flagellin family)
MAQQRNELSGRDYCQNNLYREIEADECSCETLEVQKQCIANMTAQITYVWNHPYCYPASETIQDQECWICIPSWQCAEYTDCTKDNVKYCLAVEDTFGCGQCYNGDTHVFDQQCSYCAEHAPWITIDDSLTVIEGQEVNLDLTLGHPDGRQVDYWVSAPVGSDLQWQTAEGDEGTYTIDITATDGTCTVHEKVTLSVRPKPYTSLVITSTDYESVLEPGDTQELLVSVENMGNQELENLRMTLLIDGLGVYERSTRFTLHPLDTESKLMRIDIPRTASPGRYYIRIVVSSDDIRRVIYRDFDIR